MIAQLHSPIHPSTPSTPFAQDDGAYYYVWESFNIPARPWPAEEGLVLVKEDLYLKGVPVAYMQLDDWWYVGKDYFGNVKSVTDWRASTVPRLFPNGLERFMDQLNIPVQLYTPFFSDDFVTPYNMTESTSFRGTKIVTPKDSYAFFRDLFLLGENQTGNRMRAYEVDFLDSNFAGSASMFESVFAAEQWYTSMARAAEELGVVVQYCLCSATDILQSLSLPSVVQARASGDYVNVEANAFDLGGSSLLMGAVQIAPSKDTLWTSSPQPGTMSDTEHNGLSYTTQPHVQLDAILATLSLGPVGISDGLGQVGAGLISQSFRSANDSTLLRPSRPLSWVDSALLNKTFGASMADVRSTHATIATSAHTSHYVLAWRTSEDVALGPTDLFPPPANGLALAVRKHFLDPANFFSGCLNGAPAAPGCVSILQPGDPLVVPMSGTGASNLTYISIHPALGNGAFLVGELAKFVHVSPQRFDAVALGGSGPAGILVSLRGSVGEAVTLLAVDPAGVARVATATIGAAGVAQLQM
jgi:hypothetical protein